MGGEKPNSRRMSSCRVGSPPHRRGKADHHPHPRCQRRITPAWAGKRSVELFLSVLSLDHPRVGGEKTRVFQQHFPAVGSPPRGRGKVYPFRVGPVAVRITPAWAGKRLPHPQRHQAAQDHPRVGGEKELGDRFKTAELGSPPRRRGKGWRVVDHHPLPGITPAQAGKSITFLP